MKERKHTEEQFELVCNQRNKAILERDEARTRAMHLADECGHLEAKVTALEAKLKGKKR